MMSSSLASLIVIESALEFLSIFCLTKGMVVLVSSIESQVTGDYVTSVHNLQKASGN